MKVVVTGAAGFLGSHVADHLAAQGFDVLRTDLRADPAEGVVAADLTQPEALAAVLQNADGACHLGGVGDVYLALADPALAIQANVVGTVNLLEACRRCGVRRVVFASTWEVYGVPRYQPMDELHPCDPAHPYNIGKLAAERLALFYDREFGLPVVALRIGTAWGERMRPNSVISLFIDRARAGRPLQIHGAGDQTRQFTHALDIAEAFRLALLAECRGEVFNIVAEDSISILELARLVTAHLPAPLEFLPPRAAEIPPARVSSAKAVAVLGWKPSFSLTRDLSTLLAAPDRAAASSG
jgi:UDP-glucose 4-epimerase